MDRPAPNPLGGPGLLPLPVVLGHLLDVPRHLVSDTAAQGTDTSNYVADAYEQNSSSAQAAHSMVRNAFSGIFPLFARQMYIKMGYPQASTLVAGLGFALAIAPFMLIKYGARLRAKSPITTKLVGNI